MFGNIKNIGQLNDVEPEKPLSKWDIQKRLHRVNRTIGGFAKPSFNSGKVVLYVFLGVMVTFSWLWISARTKQLRLDRRGVQTMAHITGVHHSEFLWNQMDGTFVNNYLINYQFIKGTDTINAAQVISIEKIHLYFMEDPQVNASIGCTYLSDRPQTNRLVKLTENENHQR